jgi:hypothetical protein
MARSRLAVMLVAIGASACAYGGPVTSNDALTPSPDGRTSAYIALVQTVYIKYNSARGDAYDNCVVTVDASLCREHGVATVAVWQRFLADLDTTPAPPQFAADDRTIRDHLPKGIADLQAMVAAAGRNDSGAVVLAAQAYIGDMQPAVTDALGDVYPPWRTN